jgi:hypothetical protein
MKFQCFQPILAITVVTTEPGKFGDCEIVEGGFGLRVPTSMCGSTGIIMSLLSMNVSAIVRCCLVAIIHGVIVIVASGNDCVAVTHVKHFTWRQRKLQ